jgi:uncharacterized protein YbjT (DUF2867 family)
VRPSGTLADVKTLVTTPNGKVGQEIVKLLLAQQIEVRAGVHNPAKASALAAAGAEVVAFDYHNNDSVAAALAGVTALYLAIPTGLDDVPVKAILATAKAQGVTRVVLLSAMGVENGESELRTRELDLEASGMEFTILRPNWFFQNFNTGQLENIRNGAIVEAADGAATSFIDTRDIAAVAAVALTQDGHAGQAYTLTGAVAHDRNEVAAAIASAIGKPVVYQNLDDAAFRARCAEEQWPQNIVETMSWLYGVVRAGWTSATNNTVEQLLGRKPLSLTDYAKDHAGEWA